MTKDPLDRLAFQSIAEWATEADPPPMEGEHWEWCCAVLGVDPVDFAELVKYQRGRVK